MSPFLKLEDYEYLYTDKRVRINDAKINENIGFLRDCGIPHDGFKFRYVVRYEGKRPIFHDHQINDIPKKEVVQDLLDNCGRGERSKVFVRLPHISDSIAFLTDFDFSGRVKFEVNDIRKRMKHNLDDIRITGSCPKNNLIGKRYFDISRSDTKSEFVVYSSGSGQCRFTDKDIGIYKLFSVNYVISLPKNGNVIKKDKMADVIKILIRLRDEFKDA